jgi:serine/threonine protein kinase
VLRSLMAVEPSVWLKLGTPKSFRLAGNVVARACSVLGRGAFCAAFKCRNDANGDVFVVKQALVTVAGQRPCLDTFEQLQREYDALYAFTQDAQASLMLPALYAHCPPVSEQSAFLALMPLGVTLHHLRNTMSRAECQGMVPQLLADLTAALGAAHRLGFCHADVRPGNVVQCANNRFVLIDWGLTRRPYEVMHSYTTNYHYFAARILIAADASRPIAYDPRFDREAIKYVALAFSDGAPHLLPVQWQDRTAVGLIKMRRAMLLQSRVAALEDHEYDGIDLESEIDEAEV